MGETQQREMGLEALTKVQHSIAQDAEMRSHATTTVAVTPVSMSPRQGFYVLQQAV